MTSALTARFPGTAELSRAGVAHTPTPLERMTCGTMSDGAGEGSRELLRDRLWVKRDDLTSPAYGGNKVRKLDLLLGDARARGSRAVITFGAYGSNHALATAVHARALGIEPHVVLSPQEPGPYAPRTLLAHAGLGTVIHLVDGWDGRRAAVKAKRELEQRDGIEPYILPMGGTCALGAVGYVDAALEMLGELSDPDEIDVVYVAAGTLGTAVGLALGFAAAGARTRVEAIRVTPESICNEQIAEELVRETSALLHRVDPSFPLLESGDLSLTLRHDHFEPGYGVVTPDTSHAVEVGRTCDVALETTYTGKAFAALLKDADEGALDGRGVVFWNTYNSAPYPPAGDEGLLPERLRDYLAQCRVEFGEV